MDTGLQTSAFTTVNGQRTYLSGADALSYQPITTSPSTTDVGQLISLASLGYTGPPLGSAPSFLIPTGASLESFDLGEPSPLVILVLPTVAVLALSRRRERAVQ